MPFKVETYTVAVTVNCVVPAPYIRGLIKEHADPVHTQGFDKIAAIKELRVWFQERHGFPLSIRDAKELIEAET